MEKYFIKPKEAKILKELGFNEICLKYYGKKGDKESLINIATSNKSVISLSVGFIAAAPIYTQAFDWFEKKHRLSYRKTPTYWNKDDIRNGTYEVLVVDLNNIDHVGTKAFKFNDVGFSLIFIEEEMGVDKLFKKSGAADLACIKKMINIVENRIKK